MKAIHNKDYSVVKTFKAGLFRASPSFLYMVQMSVSLPVWERNTISATYPQVCAGKPRQPPRRQPKHRLR